MADPTVADPAGAASPLGWVPAPGSGSQGDLIAAADDMEDQSGSWSAVPTSRPVGRRREVGAGTALILFGLVVVLFAAYLFGYSNLQAGRNQRRLLASYGASGEFAAFSGQTPSDGSAVAVLTVPQIALHQVVVQGTSATDTQSGPGLMPTSAVPGTRGVAVIAGRHGTYGSPFANLGELHSGAKVTIVDYLGRFTYRVVRVTELSSGGVHVVPTAAPLLYLVTSRTSWPPSGLVVVSAKLVGTPHPTAVASRFVDASQLGLGGDNGALWQFVLWGLGLALALTATVVAYRRLNRPVLVYVLSTPVLLPFLLFTFENAARLLPATM